MASRVGDSRRTIRRPRLPQRDSVTGTVAEPISRRSHVRSGRVLGEMPRDRAWFFRVRVVCVRSMGMAEARTMRQTYEMAGQATGMPKEKMQEIVASRASFVGRHRSPRPPG